MIGREARIQACVSFRAILAVKDARHEPVRVFGRRQYALDADSGLHGLAPLPDPAGPSKRNPFTAEPSGASALSRSIPGLCTQLADWPVYLELTRLAR